MSRLRVAFWSTLTALLLIAAVVAVLRFSVTAAANKPLSVPAGDREIAWFHTATNIGTWERFVAGVRYAARQQPRLRVDDSQAFPRQTTAIPEVVVSLEGSSQRLLIRWYKQSSQMKVEDWVRELARRDPPPLAIVGGGSSDRALELARALAAQETWRGPRPVLAITTATAGELVVESDAGIQKIDLMQIYAGRSFRFCFTNKQMARAVVDFVWSRPDLRPRGTPLVSLAAVPNAAGLPWAALGSLAAQEEFPGEVVTLEWQDDPFSIDLAQQFRTVLFVEHDEIDPDTLRPWMKHVSQQARLDISSSIGGYLRPNNSERSVINTLINGNFLFRPIPRMPLQRSLLVLPTVPPPARRILAGLTGAAPHLGKQLVAVSGDGISFNHVYRDGALIWNVRLVPVPLVCFAHQNPVAWDNSPSALDRQDSSVPDRQVPTLRNGTDDVLHFADVARILAEAAYDLPPAHPGGGPLADADELVRRLRSRDPEYFDVKGNRLAGRGEYVIYLRPWFNGESAIPSATIEVWTAPNGGAWERVGDPFEVNYK